jgi:hypothetical protein
MAGCVPKNLISKKQVGMQWAHVPCLECTGTGSSTVLLAHKAFLHLDLGKVTFSWLILESEEVEQGWLWVSFLAPKR